MIDQAVAVTNAWSDKIVVGVMCQIDYQVTIWKTTYWSSSTKIILASRINLAETLLDVCQLYRDKHSRNAKVALEIYKVWLDILADRQPDWKPIAIAMDRADAKARTR